MRASAAHTNGFMLVVFLKAPVAGQVKTRIAATAGAGAALRIYRELVARTLIQAKGVSLVEIRYTPDEALDAIHAVIASQGSLQSAAASQWTFQPQGPGDLGEKLARAFLEHRPHPGAPILVIGADCPYIEPGDLIEAAKRLQHHDVVLGPARDGGYWLIGARRDISPLFEEIDWGTDKVLRQTLAKAAGHQLSLTLLRELDDIDTEEDWRQWLNHRRQSEEQ